MILSDLRSYLKQQRRVALADLVNHFKPEDVVTVDQQDGETHFERLNSKNISLWLEEYSVGELWQQRIINKGQP